jgi:hypothetical protein
MVLDETGVVCSAVCSDDRSRNMKCPTRRVVGSPVFTRCPRSILVEFGPPPNADQLSGKPDMLKRMSSDPRMNDHLPVTRVTSPLRDHLHSIGMAPNEVLLKIRIAHSSNSINCVSSLQTHTT